MLTRTIFALLLVAFPVALGLKIVAQRAALGRSPVVLGAGSARPWEAWWERVTPFGLFFWPASWLWVVLGDAPLSALTRRAAGLVLLLAGAAFTLASVFLMGRAWRIGIDPENTSELAEEGPYRWIRHPIYAGMLLMLVGNVLVVPHPAVEIAAVLTALGVALQARREEQHLLRVFGDRYARYMRRTGSFVPRFAGRRDA